MAAEHPCMAAEQTCMAAEQLCTADVQPCTAAVQLASWQLNYLLGLIFREVKLPNNYFLQFKNIFKIDIHYLVWSFFTQI